jgi:hypothetical protein
MWKALKRHWRELRSSRPGRRFQKRYQRNQRAKSEQSVFRRLAQPVAGFVVLAVGVFFCLVPGPGLPIVVVGAALLAGEWLVIAGAMDWSEIRLRKIFAWARRRWIHAPLTAKCAAVVLAAATVVGAGYGGYQVFVH